jgi:hypothetical protein
MDLDHYITHVDAFADKSMQQDEAAYKLLGALMRTSVNAQDCVTFREANLIRPEIEAYTPLLETGIFPDPNPLRRLAWFAFSFDVANVASNRALEEQCRPYALDQPLFQGAPKVFEAIRRKENSGSPDYELLDENAIKCVDDSEIYRVEQGFAKLAPQLPAGLVSWGRDAHPNAQRYLRLNPCRYYTSQPLMQILEAALVPADPTWMANVALRPGMKTFASYLLLDSDPKEDFEQSWDYRVRGARKLEITAQRREQDYLTMMIEELPKADDANGLMIAKCIHLDTKAIAGTPAANVVLNHLDLAINVYRGADRAARMSSSLQDGKVVDATFRTHLYRIENVPFSALFDFAAMFLTSRYLLKEWISDALR